MGKDDVKMADASGEGKGGEVVAKNIQGSGSAHQSPALEPVTNPMVGQQWIELNADKKNSVLVNVDGAAATQAAGQTDVKRTMYERVGGEVARASTKVTFKPNTPFPSHVHDGGEEFVVLSGVWKDKWGNFPKYTYIRNYIGSSHEPSIGEEGCEIFVKLRQMSAKVSELEHWSVDFSRANNESVRLYQGWSKNEHTDTEYRELFESPYERVYAEYLEPKSVINDKIPKGGQEIFVIDGEFEDALGKHKEHSWARYGADGESRERKAGAEGALLYVKEGHRDAPEVGPPPRT